MADKWKYIGALVKSEVEQNQNPRLMEMFCEYRNSLVGDNSFRIFPNNYQSWEKYLKGMSAADALASVYREEDGERMFDLSDEFIYFYGDLVETCDMYDVKRSTPNLNFGEFAKYLASNADLFIVKNIADLPYYFEEYMKEAAPGVEMSDELYEYLEEYGDDLVAANWDEIIQEFSGTQQQQSQGSPQQPKPVNELTMTDLENIVKETVIRMKKKMK